MYKVSQYCPDAFKSAILRKSQSVTTLHRKTPIASIGVTITYFHGILIVPSLINYPPGDILRRFIAASDIFVIVTVDAGGFIDSKPFLP
jgi:hypothetical protein